MKHRILQDAALLKGRSGVTRSSLHNPTWKNRGGQGHVLARNDLIHPNAAPQKDKMTREAKKFPGHLKCKTFPSYQRVSWYGPGRDLNLATASTRSAARLPRSGRPVRPA